MPAKKSKTSKKTGADSLFWYFPSTDHGEDSGFSDSQLEYFQGDHEKYIAREAIQNAVDARLDYSNPVKVVFDKSSISITEIPGHAELLDRMKRCAKFVKGQPKAESFFEAASALLKSKEIPILKISDFNTKGLTGTDDDIDGNWYRLVRATGTSSSKGATGGSFGIGKGAPIAASALRTVFYSSINEKGEIVFQGKARLVSHHDEKRDVRQGVGFYGLNGYQAVRKTSMVPEILKRSERGTDIFVVGYKSGPDWKQKLVKSVLHNFWLSIHRGALEVVVRDGEELVISRDNLRECLEDYEAQDAMHYFEALTKPSQTFEKELKNLGTVFLFVRKDESYPRKVMMVRKPLMLVREKPYWVLREPYAALFICENDKGNPLLRELEPPAHNEWDPARAENGKIILRELDEFIKQSLKTMAESSTSVPEDIPGLSNYLPDSDNRDYLPSNSGDPLEETGTSTSEESGREVGAEMISRNADAEIVARKGIVTNQRLGLVKINVQNHRNEGGGGKVTGPEEGEKEGLRIKTSSINFRSFIQKGAKGIEYHLAIKSKEDCEGALNIVAVGDDVSYPIELASVTDVKSGKECVIDHSFIKGLKIKEGDTLKLSVKLISDRRYSLGVETYEG